MSGFPTDMADTAIALTAVGKKYPFSRGAAGQSALAAGEFWALRDVSFSTPGGRIIGVVGRNGAGKSTLLNIIAGTISPTHGKVDIRGKVLGLFNLGIGFQDEFSGRENIFLNGTLMGASRAELEERLAQIIDFSELGDFIDMPLGSYSQGMRLRLGFSIITHLDFDVLLLDEILAVGDVLFQNKCFEKIMDLKRAGKTLLVSSQALELIERLSDSVALIDHGSLLHFGPAREGIDKYRKLLATEEFFIGPSRSTGSLIESTKRWADDVSQWGTKLGTKEVVIEAVEFRNRLGLRSQRLSSKAPFSVKVAYDVRNNVRNPHFGIAFFREDGVYCYGPNTDFDGIFIPELGPGKGFFALECRKLLLAPGRYRVSVAIWDSSETVAFDYHQALYPLDVRGPSNAAGELSSIPAKTSSRYFPGLAARPQGSGDLKLAQQVSSEAIQISSLKVSDGRSKAAGVFMTGEPLEITVTLKQPLTASNAHAWVGIYRDDDVYCQGSFMPATGRQAYKVSFPSAYFLPGSYKISFGIWSQNEGRFLMASHGAQVFRMASHHPDHGTVYFPHKWKWGPR